MGSKKEDAYQQAVVWRPSQPLHVRRGARLNYLAITQCAVTGSVAEFAAALVGDGSGACPRMVARCVF